MSHKYDPSWPLRWRTTANGERPIPDVHFFDGSVSVAQNVTQHMWELVRRSDQERGVEDYREASQYDTISSFGRNARTPKKVYRDSTQPTRLPWHTHLIWFRIPLNPTLSGLKSEQRWEKDKSNIIYIVHIFISWSQSWWYSLLYFQQWG